MLTRLIREMMERLKDYWSRVTGLKKPDTVTPSSGESDIDIRFVGRPRTPWGISVGPPVQPMVLPPIVIAEQDEPLLFRGSVVEDVQIDETVTHTCPYWEDHLLSTTEPCQLCDPPRIHPPVRCEHCEMIHSREGLESAEHICARCKRTVRS